MLTCEQVTQGVAPELLRITLLVPRGIDSSQAQRVSYQHEDVRAWGPTVLGATGMGAAVLGAAVLGAAVS